MQKILSLVIKANQDFIRHSEEDIKSNAQVLNSFYEAISNVYIPLLEMIERLEADNISYRFALVLPPILCNMLSDTVLQDEYIKWLDKRNDLGKKELRRNSDNEEICKIITKTIETNKKRKADFVEKYNKNLIPVFADYMAKGYIELLGTCGTDIFMPHYADLKEIISAQIESGLHAYRQYFGVMPEGFWLPEMGYTPGIEKLIRAYGYTYTILDSRSVLFAETVPKAGIFYPCRTENSLVIFARNRVIDSELFGENGIIYSECYRNMNRDIGYELPMEKLTPLMDKDGIRYSTGFKYWNRCFKDSGHLYSEECALKQAQKDAENFVQKRLNTLTKAEELLPDYNFVSEVCTLDISKFRSTWCESILWLEEVIRKASDAGLSLLSCDRMCDEQYNLEKVEPYFSAGIGQGYGENLLSSKNCWMMRYVRKSCERMIDLAGRFPMDTGLKTRLLNLGAKELMLAQNSSLAKKINRSEFPQFAEKRFKESIAAFTAVFDSLGSNTVSTEWLTKLEAKDSIFPWMNYRIFTKKR